MIDIKVAKSAGFCFGVDRAVKMVYNELEKGTKVATLGPIIHNQDVVNDMKNKGARVIEYVDELPKTLGGKIKRAQIRHHDEENSK